MTDNKPAQITTWSWACTSQNGGASGCDPVAINGTDFNDTVNLPNGASIVYTVTANVSGGATGNLANTATINVPSGYSDTTPGNNSATDTDTFTMTSADLSITKDDGVTTYNPGASITYTIVVSNTGPDAVTGATVTDSFDSSKLNSISWTCSASPGATCTASGAGNINDTVDLPVGATVTYTVNANINGGATGDLVNTASISVPAGVNDPDTGNNSATDTDTQVNPSIDLSITKDDGTTAYGPGTTLTYTIVVTNNGSATATGFNVTDTVPLLNNTFNGFLRPQQWK